ncbi:MAG: NifB/NifX family molybdenum-iron cluster-binding protein [Desulfobacteraceae bacterium]|nr:NifB/NifX family molybdenum-iron cluster-binding protein [Desulfobacteraceae bacterium]
MKIAVSSKGKTLDAELDARFGRAACFIVLDPNHQAYDVVENTQNLNAAQGAGIQAAKTVAGKGVGAVLTGSCGPKAYAVLERAGISVITGVSGSVRQALEQYKNGELRPAGGPNVNGHWM